MAQGQQSDNGASRIAREKKRKWGYDPRQVDEFLEQTHARYDNDDPDLTQGVIQNVSFDLRKGGYVISQVDATLERLERAVVDKQTARDIQRSGRVAWKAQADQLYRELAAHANRAERERFAPGEGKAPSYDRKQVDTVVDNIIEKAGLDLKIAAGIDVDPDDAEALEDVTSSAVANTVFTQRKGKKGYDERQVDYFLNACVALLSRLESYDRIADYEGAETTVAAPMVANPAVSQSPATQPLFDAANVVAGQSGLAAGSPSSYDSASLQATQAYAGANGNDSFDDVSRAEQAIFDQSATPATQAYGTTATGTADAAALSGDSAETGYAGLAGLAATTAASAVSDEPDHAGPDAQTAAYNPFGADVPPSFAPASGASHAAPSSTVSNSPATSSPATSSSSASSLLGADVDGIPAAASAPSPDEPHKPGIADIPHITPAPRTIYPSGTAATNAAVQHTGASHTDSASPSASSSSSAAPAPSFAPASSTASTLSTASTTPSVSPFSTFPSASASSASSTSSVPSTSASSPTFTSSASSSTPSVSPFSTFPSASASSSASPTPTTSPASDSASSAGSSDVPPSFAPAAKPEGSSQQNSHLAALASMAESIGKTPSPTSSAYETTSNYQLPPLPSLDSVSIPDLPPFRRTDDMTDAPSAVTTGRHAAVKSGDADSATSFASVKSHRLDVDIPDLSFPSFGDDDDDQSADGSNSANGKATL
ncbi:DivIVA domain-containing protein [Bifidobacterium choloepi]|uniref:DivIVA domain-containing protein n=1 Tax=Bifidobacterium choloepi TaxID=2614131 RepID=A0A6I5NPH9_9BIFI|nr:DivIVA domain-containing protein [Bifidobacterium choloepi]NEG70612.1 DivIVA domain-containing protein [Bifidobacterium choloepi]